MTPKRPPKPPTQAQLEVHAFMLAFHEREGVWPSLREICDEFGFASTNSAHAHLVALKRKGLARQRPKCMRGWIAIRPEPATEEQS